MKKPFEFLSEIPGLGEVLIEPFLYSNGRQGFNYVTTNEKGTQVVENLTINLIDDEDNRTILLKMWNEAEIVNRFLLEKTSIFKKIGVKQIGINYAMKVELKEDCYEEI